ncbi:MAG: DNA polymerase III subunit delta' C-terminal domain-containing protein [Christensenellales bacterium]|jgi:DNA polymerase-3 subunit delta'
MNHARQYGDYADLARRLGNARPHAYMILGHKDGGGSALALDIAAYALRGDSQAAIGGIKERMAAGAHPDFIEIRPDNSIKVDTVRELVAAMQIKPHEGGRRAVIIYSAEKMTVQAQNSLLKLLEEPPQYALFILLCGNLSAMLPTVRSRCAIMHMRAEGYEAAKAAALHMGEARAEAVANISGGFIERAKALSKNELFWQTRERAVNCLLEGKKGYHIWRDAFKQEAAGLGDFIEAMLLLLRDALAASLSAKIHNTDIRDRIFALSKSFTQEGLLSIIRILQKSKRDLNANANAALVADGLVIRVMEVVDENRNRGQVQERR